MKKEVEGKVKYPNPVQLQLSLWPESIYVQNLMIRFIYILKQRTDWGLKITYNF